MEELILKSVTSAGLPLESAEAIQSLLCNLGVSETTDVQFVNEDDLTGILKVVQGRKLVAYWKSIGYILKQFALQQAYLYRAMHFSAKRRHAIACRLSVCLSICL